MTDSVHAAALPGVVFAEYMKNKSGIPTVKRQKEAYKSLKRPVVYGTGRPKYCHGPCMPSVT